MANTRESGSRICQVIEHEQKRNDLELFRVNCPNDWFMKLVNRYIPHNAIAPAFLSRALAVIEQELDGGESRVKVALEIVKLAGIQMGSIGPHDSEGIVEEEARSRNGGLLFNFNHLTDFSDIRRELTEKGMGE